MTGEEKLDAAEAAKERGTMFFKQGKMRLAAAKYMRVIELLEYEKPSDNELKSKRDALLLAGYLNRFLHYSYFFISSNCLLRICRFWEDYVQYLLI